MQQEVLAQFEGTKANPRIWNDHVLTLTGRGQLRPIPGFCSAVPNVWHTRRSTYRSESIHANIVSYCEA